jgi:hypothetical protein
MAGWIARHDHSELSTGDAALALPGLVQADSVLRGIHAYATKWSATAFCLSCKRFEGHRNPKQGVDPSNPYLYHTLDINKD